MTRTDQAVALKTLSLINWGVLTLAVLASLVGAVICLLMWPFPQMAGDHGGRLASVWTATGLSVLVALTAMLSTWLLDKRHPMLWAGQGLLAVVVIASLVYGVLLR